MWTDERVDTLRKLYAEGKSCGQIAAVVGKSRNAVIGRVHRMGLPLRGPTGPTTDGVARRVKARQEARQRIAAMPKPNPIKRVISTPAVKSDGYVADPSLPLADAPLVTLMDLENHHCRWMHDDRFCGCAKVPGTSYCEHHLRAAYTVYKPTGKPFSLMRKFTPAPEAVA